jgi:hypothetical protein
MAISGTNRNEEIYGTLNGEVINGLGGEDRIYAKAGDDTVIGSFGNDWLNGGWGNDEFYFGSNHGSRDYVSGFERETGNNDHIALAESIDFYSVTRDLAGVKITATDLEYQGLGTRTTTFILFGVYADEWRDWGGSFGTGLTTDMGPVGNRLIEFDAINPIV